MAEVSSERTRAFVQKAAARNGWLLNPDQTFTDTIAAGLTTNAQRFGYYLCPCRDGDGERRADRDIVCPCAYAAADIAEYGQCFCGLYLSPEKASSGEDVAQIPERRPAQP